MKITILQGAFLPVPTLRGGAIEKAWERLGKEFSCLGHEVTHVSRLCDGLPEMEEIEGVRHIRIKGADAVDNSVTLKCLELPYVWRAREHLPEADILVTHAFWAPLILNNKSYGKIYVHVGRYPKGQLKFYRKANKLQAPSSAIAEAIKREIPRHENRISMIPYPLPWELMELKPIEQRKKRILYFGRIHPEKGILELVRAWNQLLEDERGQWELRIVGPWKKEEGGGGLEYFNQIQNQCDRHSSRVELLEPIFDIGLIRHEYQEARILAYPSKAEKGETFGLSVLEAMSHGCVPLVSSLQCFRDFVSADNAFIMPEKRDSFEKTLKKKLTEAIHAEDNISELSIKAYEKALEYEPKKIAQRFLEDFEKISS